ncbi:MAG: DegT/DnrJ/EryC1/StrS family aminotransferase [Candidatus Omnitrophota bacterium]
MRKISLPVYDESKCFLFALGRNAMYAACRSAGVNRGDEILTPAFDCDGSLQPFKAAGAKTIFFKSDPYTFAVDLTDIRKRLTVKTKLIHVINHFGMPQPWEELRSLSRETGIPILEDNAYSLFSKLEREPFGLFGDMAIFSLRKNLPLIDGGLLRVNNPSYLFRLEKKAAPLFYSTEASGILTIIKRMLGYYKMPPVLRRAARRFAPAIEPPVPLYSDPKKGCPDWPWRDETGKEFSRDYLRPISGLARFQLSGFSERDLEIIADNKKRYYCRLNEAIGSLKGIKALWPKLPEGAVPFCFSFLVNSNRDILFEELRKKYDVMVWPTLPQAVLNNLKDYPEVELLGRKLFQINLPSDKVALPDFSKYLNNLVAEFEVLAKKHICPN